MNQTTGQVNIKVVGVGGGGGNAVQRMAKSGLTNLDFIAINTDQQALKPMKNVSTLAIGPSRTSGVGSGGDPDIGRKAIRESQDQVHGLLEGADMVFIAAGMGGGTGTGAAPMVAEIAKKHGALTIGVVTRPFSFEGTLRQGVANRGLLQLRQRIDTMITVDNDRLLSSLDGTLSLDKAFAAADEILLQGVEGICDILLSPGLVNVDFADVKSIMLKGGNSFMAIGEGKGKSAADDAIKSALSNPMFDAPLKGSNGILFNVRGGNDLSIGQVQEVAGIIRKASQSDTQIIFGVVQDKKFKKKVRITLVATGIQTTEYSDIMPMSISKSKPVPKHTTNGHEPTKQLLPLPKLV